ASIFFDLLSRASALLGGGIRPSPSPPNSFDHYTYTLWNIFSKIMDRIQLPSLLIAFCENMLLCLDRKGELLDCLSNHTRRIRWIASVKGLVEPSDMLCSYDGDWAMIWQERGGCLELLNSF